MIPGYHEEQRRYFPLLKLATVWFWWIFPLIAYFNPELAHSSSIWVLKHWPRITYHVLVKDE